MTPGTVMDIGRQAIETALMMATPLFLVALLTGLIVSVFQAATQINEMTLTFVPKLVAIFITLMISGPWMITLMTDFTRRLYDAIPSLIG
ncbi:MAG: flagellar biosynthesis protein FliQ [Rhodocyclaceae bacterium]|jgi:flagellar biosynthetic protein FliQ|nr:flagellar biosynthesis protein FliQ [Rhodocyclaceae bacterium]MCL4757126.1 flagellar biosynthesis protein FliQ [Rhodocyclaceae bacterium]